MMAYLVMMTNRLLELHRVLKPTGSLYLHCDPVASHYLKIVLDQVFGVENYQNEIVWKRTSSHSDTKRYARISDTILFYSKSESFTWNPQRLAYDEDYLDHYYSNIDNDGRRYTYADLSKPKGSVGYFYTLLQVPPPPNGWRMPESKAKIWLEEGRIAIPPTGATPRYKRYTDEIGGVVLSNIWTDIPPVNSQAKASLNYPTQKPQALLERIIMASCPENGVVLDPFSGCGTAVVAAQTLGRQWIGIDITHLAIAIIEKRMRDAFPGIVFEVKGTPKDYIGACDLARRDKYQFQWWACSLVNAQPYRGKKKGADSGIDGLIFFQDDASGAKKIVVSVKGGDSVTRTMIADLKNSVEREGAKIGLFVTLTEPTGPMRDEAASAGFYESPTNNLRYLKIQILTISGLLGGTQRPEYFDLSRGTLTFQQTATAKPAQKQTDMQL